MAPAPTAPAAVAALRPPVNGAASRPPRSAPAIRPRSAPCPRVACTLWSMRSSPSSVRYADTPSFRSTTQLSSSFCSSDKTSEARRGPLNPMTIRLSAMETPSTGRWRRRWAFEHRAGHSSDALRSASLAFGLSHPRPAIDPASESELGAELGRVLMPLEHACGDGAENESAHVGGVGNAAGLRCDASEVHELESEPHTDQQCGRDVRDANEDHDDEKRPDPVARIGDEK